MDLHHSDGQSCPLCNDKLLSAHPYLKSWFGRVKAKYVNTHISWAFRNMAEQNQFYKDGRTRAQWPKSPHNHMIGDMPQALALDIFQLDEDGIARFSPAFYNRLNQENEVNLEPIFWGGKFKTLGDQDHFELTLKD